VDDARRIPFKDNSHLGMLYSGFAAAAPSDDAHCQWFNSSKAAAEEEARLNDLHCTKDPDRGCNTLGSKLVQHSQAKYTPSSHRRMMSWYWHQYEAWSTTLCGQCVIQNPLYP